MDSSCIQGNITKAFLAVANTESKWFLINIDMNAISVYSDTVCPQSSQLTFL